MSDGRSSFEDQARSEHLYNVITKKIAIKYFQRAVFNIAEAISI